MKKVFFSTITALCLLTAFSCSKDSDPRIIEKEVLVPTFMPEIMSYWNLGLEGKVKQMEMKRFLPKINPTDQSIEKGNPTRKDIFTFDNRGLVTKIEIASILNIPNGIYRDRAETTYEYDKKFRLTSKIDKQFIYLGNDISKNAEGIKIEKTTREYNESTLKGYEWFYQTDNESTTPLALVRKRTFVINKDGTYDPSNYIEEFRPKSVSANTSASTPSEDEYLYYKLEEVILAKDTQQNWTEAYTLAQYFDKDGALIHSQPHTYMTRSFIYY